MNLYNTFLALLFMSLSIAQESPSSNLPYAAIPAYPKEYTSGTVVSRMIDGLGFRYYWATEGLKPKDLAYKPSATGRTIEQTLDHLYGLSTVIYNSAIKEVNDRTSPLKQPSTFEEKRRKTLVNLKKASEIFLDTKDLGEHMVVFKSDKGTSENPFWNQINGPIEDAIWHSGQIVMMRRASGNPIDSGVNVFMGIRKIDK